MKYVGKRIPKSDAYDKVIGKTRYIQDIKIPGMLYGKIKRSKVAYGRITNIDTSKAEKLSGVIAVITSKDTPMKKYGYARDRYPLVHKIVRRVGDEIAAVAAISEEIAEKAIDLIKVEIKEMDGVFDMEYALDKSAPCIHPSQKATNNIFTEFNYSHGNIENGLAKSDVVVNGKFTLPYQAHCALSPSGVIAEWNGKDNLTLYNPTQIPFLCIRDITEALDIHPSKVRIIQPTIGGAFGAKLDVYNFEVICALLSKKTGKPVRILFDREEEFKMDPFRPKTIVNLTTGASKIGKILARKAEVIIEGGAYISWGATSPIVQMHTIGCLYNTPHVKYNAKIVYTNNPHTGAMRGFGNPELMFAIETQMDEIAKKIGMDSLELRKKNANKTGEVTPQGSKIISCGFTECLEEAAKRINWNSKKHNNKNSRVKTGIGIAAVFHVGGGARIYRSDGCGAIVKIDDFGKVTVVSGATDIGQGADTILVQIAAEELSIPIENVNITNTDSEIKPWDVGVHASRTTFIAGNAVKLASKDAKKELIKAASEFLNEKEENLKLEGGIIFSTKNPDKKTPYDKIVRAYHFKTNGNIIIGRAFYDPPNEMTDLNYKGNISATYSFGAHTALVEVDTETGKVFVKKIVAAHDIGTVINPMYAEGQVEGGVMMGLGYGLKEEVIMEKGAVKNPNFTNYYIPCVQDTPPIEVVFVDTKDPKGPFGAKGLSESAMIPTASAIANAVADALGKHPRELPITPERLLKLLMG